jgi:hypothetical protein
MEHVPDHLYKYFASDCLNVLADLLIRYTPLSYFNDPFDGNPHVAGAYSSDPAADTDLLAKYIAADYETLPDVFRDIFSARRWEEIARDSLQRDQPDVLAALSGRAEQYIAFVREKATRTFGALCLSEVPDSLLMWSHYASSHAGFLLEFDAHHPYFHECGEPETDSLRLQRVLYRDARPSNVLSDLTLSDMFLVKSNQWSYEREWRVFRRLSEAFCVRDEGGHAIHLFPFPPDAVRSIIFGARANSNLLDDAVALIRAQPPLSHVTVRRIVPDESHFLLRLQDNAI